MTRRKITLRIQKALDNIDRYIRDTTPDSRVARGLAREGYDGGYAQALMDVQLIMNDVEPQRSCWK